jgi:hypothetical protein
MAKAKKVKKAKKATPYLRRLVEDERVHGHMRDAAAGIQQAYGRVSRKGGRATEDQKLYDHVREAATSARRAVVAVRTPPEPTHRGRKLVLIGLAGGGVAYGLKRARRGKLEAELSDGFADAEPASSGSGAEPSPTESKPATVG